MKIRFLFYINFLCIVFSFPAFAVQRFSQELSTIWSSDHDAKPELVVRIDEGQPNYIHKNKKFNCSGSVNHAGGCTRVIFYAALGGLKLTSDGLIREITLFIGLKDVEVEISSDLKKGSCLFDAVLKHELTHLALHRRILKRFAPEMAKAVLSVVESMSSPLTQTQVNKIDQVLQGFVSRMMAEDKKQNDLMDSQEAYRHLQNQCQE